MDNNKDSRLNDSSLLNGTLRTSTPRPSPTRRLAQRKYCLSEMPSEPHSPGPILAARTYKDNVSLYHETKSSGLARRIVAYNEEVSQQLNHTHQPKYASPGLFPIVHLFKHKPIESPATIQIKLASPDVSRSCSPEHRTKLLENLTRPRRSSLDSEKPTKSVLEALKEISRKRIRSEEDVVDDDLKRHKTDVVNGHSTTPVTTNKRNRVDSPTDVADSPGRRQEKKRFCSYDELAASKSSMDYSVIKKRLASKRKTISTSTEPLDLEPLEPKQIKVVSVETQTQTEPKDVPKPVEEEQPEKVPEKCRNDLIKVIDDAPLTSIRKNRLSALVGKIVGKPISVELEDDTLVEKPVENIDVVDNKEKETESSTITTAVSPTITSTKPKTVTFSTPPIVTSPSSKVGGFKFDLSTPPISASTPSTIGNTSIIPLKASPGQLNLTKPTITTGITTTSVSTATASLQFSFGNTQEKPIESKEISSSKPLEETLKPTPPPPSFTFGAGSTSKSGLETSTATTTIPSFGFGTSTTTTAPIFVLGSTTTVTASPTFGGVVSTASMVSPTFSAGSTGKTDSIFGATSNAVAPTFGVGTKPSTTAIPSFGTGVVTSTTAAPTFGLGTKPSTTTVASFGTTFGSTTTSAASFTFGSTTTTAPSTFGTTVTSTFGNSTSFGAPSNTSIPTFGAVAPATTAPIFRAQTTTAPTFGTVSTISASTFGATTTAPTYGGITTSTAPSFGSSTFGATTTPAQNSMFASAKPTFPLGQTLTNETASKPMFSFGDTTKNFAAETTKPSFSFGGKTVPTSEPPFSFGGSTAKEPTFSFGKDAKSSADFSFKPATPSFGFGQSEAKPTAFSVVPTTTSTSFKAASFGGFGGTPATTTTSSGFGPTTSTTFTFGGSNFNNPPTTTTSSTFATSSFGAPSNVFEAKPTAAAAAAVKGFGPSGFGSNLFNNLTTTGTTATTTTASFGFDSAPPNPFGGASSGFGSFNNSFGTANNNFGGDKTKNFAFGAENKSPPPAAPTFGGPSSAFGKPTTMAPPPPPPSFNASFGNAAAPPSFGTAAAAATTTTQPANGGFNFGQQPQAASSAPFKFGGTEPVRPSFNFSGSANPPPAFGSFSGPAAASFPPPNVVAPQTGTPAIFNIGSGGNRPRTLRAKRRTQM